MAWKDPAVGLAWKRAYEQRWHKALSDRWRAAGACFLCGEPVTTFKRCRRCRVKAREAHARRMARKPAVFCVVHPTVQIKLTGCRVCAAIRAVNARWAKARGAARCA